ERASRGRDGRRRGRLLLRRHAGARRPPGHAGRPGPARGGDPARGAAHADHAVRRAGPAGGEHRATGRARRRAGAVLRQVGRHGSRRRPDAALPGRRLAGAVPAERGRQRRPAACRAGRRGQRGGGGGLRGQRDGRPRPPAPPWPRRAGDRTRPGQRGRSPRPGCGRRAHRGQRRRAGRALVQADAQLRLQRHLGHRRPGLRHDGGGRGCPGRDGRCGARMPGSGRGRRGAPARRRAGRRARAGRIDAGPVVLHRARPRARQAHRDRPPQWPGGAARCGAGDPHAGQPHALGAGQADGAAGRL
ncbi:MAG: 2-dehydropantoate 2-reductase, partial [uncultured Ramlibacter sp.]